MTMLNSRRFAAIAAILVALLMQACGLFSSRGKYIMPEESTARDQFSVARDQERRAKGTIYEKANPENWREENRKAIAAYDAVISRFGSDETYTPAAWLARAELQFDLGADQNSSYSDAVSGFRIAADKYSAQPDIRVAALWGLGRTYERIASASKLGSPKERENRTNAQAAFKAILDEFSGSESPEVRQVVEQARLRYRIVR